MPVLSANAAADVIRHFADSLPGPYGYESSVKFTGDAVALHRFLVTFPTVALTLGADLVALLTQLQFPAADLPRLQHMLSAGDVIHLGFEAEAHGYLCKVYVEAAQRTRHLWAAADLPEGVAVNVHRALKWRPTDAHCVETHYDWLPCRSAQNLIGHMQQLCDWLSEQALTELLAPVLARVPVIDLQLLRVSEPGNKRQSFDLNCYDAELCVADLEPWLMAPVMLDKLNSLLQLRELDLGRQSLGHVAAGIARSGQPFLTVYYGGCEKGSFTHG